MNIQSNTPATALGHDKLETTARYTREYCMCEWRLSTLGGGSEAGAEKVRYTANPLVSNGIRDQTR